MIFIIKPTDFGHYQFSLAIEENILLTSLQTYPTVKQCKDGINTLKDSLNHLNRLCCTNSSIGGFYFYVCDKNRDPIAMSDIFSSDTSMKRYLNMVLNEGSKASIEDQIFPEYFIRDNKNIPEMVA